MVETGDTAMKGIEITEKAFCNLALIDVRLPEMEGIELLSKLYNTKPKMRKIIVTGYLMLQNTISTLNRGGGHLRDETLRSGEDSSIHPR